MYRNIRKTNTYMPFHTSSFTLDYLHNLSKRPNKVIILNMLCQMSVENHQDNLVHLLILKNKHMGYIVHFLQRTGRKMVGENTFRNNIHSLIHLSLHLPFREQSRSVELDFLILVSPSQRKQINIITSYR